MTFELKDGWEPLCDFLEVEVPDKPFPHENKNAEITEKFLKTHPLVYQAKKELVIRLGGLSGLFFVGVYYLRRNPSCITNCAKGAVQMINQLKFWG